MKSFYWAIVSKLLNVRLGRSLMVDQDLFRPDALPVAQLTVST